MKYLLIAMGVSLLTALLTACAGESESVDPTGRTWQLTELSGNPALANAMVDLIISDDVVSGSAGCNRYNGPAVVQDDGSMTLGPNFAATRMACEQPIMDQEQRYLDVLTQVASYQVVGGELLLKDADEVVVARFE